jgi:hypothetical protein
MYDLVVTRRSIRLATAGSQASVRLANFINIQNKS